MIKLKNNVGKIIQVTKRAYEVLYKDREGFSIYDEKAELEKKVKEDEEKKKEAKKATTAKKTETKKSVKKDAK